VVFADSSRASLSLDGTWEFRRDGQAENWRSIPDHESLCRIDFELLTVDQFDRK
jgi:hypothetical protein